MTTKSRATFSRRWCIVVQWGKTWRHQCTRTIGWQRGYCTDVQFITVGLGSHFTPSTWSPTDFATQFVNFTLLWISFIQNNFAVSFLVALVGLPRTQIKYIFELWYFELGLLFWINYDERSIFSAGIFPKFIRMCILIRIYWAELTNNFSEFVAWQHKILYLTNQLKNIAA